MANSEACQVWIEQRSEELYGDGLPYEVVGRIVSKEITKYFETEIKPRTLAQKARRNHNKNAVTNVTKKSETTVNAEFAFDSGRGGKRKNAGRPSKPVFNTANENIDWAKWSWNPVTGCEHKCSYCYARDIVNRFPDQFPKGFKPHFRPERLEAPYCTVIPDRRKTESGINNVFVCSIADLFGDWVPEKWINQVLEVCSKSQRWNYIFLTKNPKRYLDFEFPPNAWLGATGDINKRAAEAQEILLQIKSHVTFLSCEPLLEKIELQQGAVAWVIIGGCSKTTQAKAMQPQLGWIGDLLIQAGKYGINIYQKPNLTIVKEYPKI